MFMSVGDVRDHTALLVDESSLILCGLERSVGIVIAVHHWDQRIFSALLIAMISGQFLT